MNPLQTGVMTALAVQLVAYPVATLSAHQDATQSRQTPAAQERAEPGTERRPVAVKLDVRFKVSVKDGGPLPSRGKIEISGQEQACGDPHFPDVTAAFDGQGLATFRLPICVVSAKVNEPGYVAFRKMVDLVAYLAAQKPGPAGDVGEPAPIELILELEH